jgi:hypothetical protein
MDMSVLISTKNKYLVDTEFVDLEKTSNFVFEKLIVAKIVFVKLFP